MSLTKLLRDNGLAERATVHGFRSTFRTWASEKTSADNAVMELSLAHVIGNAVEQAYARSDLLAKRRTLMEQWGDFVKGFRGERIIISAQCNNFIELFYTHIEYLFARVQIVILCPIKFINKLIAHEKIIPHFMSTRSNEFIALQINDLHLYKINSVDMSLFLKGLLTFYPHCAILVS